MQLKTEDEAQSMSGSPQPRNTTDTVQAPTS
jgi:hypothetical protein